MTICFMTIFEVAEYLELHEMTVYRYIKKKILPIKKIGGRYKVTKEQLDAWLNKKLSMK